MADVPDRAAMFYGERTRAECVEWIQTQVASRHGACLSDDMARDIMDHCFTVSLALLKGRVSEWATNVPKEIVNAGNISV